ncbi:hypothetical protein TgHK011_000229 [Trichoderma gracile]|nr:hypothetical protein TgHK011_000229 [Trichoderma gracile]
MTNPNNTNDTGPSRPAITENPSTTTSSITTPPPSYHSRNPSANPLEPTLTHTHTTGTIVLPYDNTTTTSQPTQKPNIVRESIEACIECCCVHRVPSWDWSSDYSTTPYPSSLSSYTTDSYSRTESMRSRDRVSDAEPVQVEDVKKNKDVEYAKQEGMCSTSHGSAGSSSQQCCRRC